MPVRYAINGKLVEIELVGYYELEEWLDLLRAALDDPDCPDPARIIVDVTGSDVARQRSEEDIRRSGRTLGEYGDRLEAVAAVADDMLTYGVLRQAAARAEIAGIRVAVVRSREEALEFLGLS